MCEDGFSKMRVSLAAQVMSGTVAAGIYMHAITHLLPQEATHTAEFVQQVDKLFDCFNSVHKYHFKQVLGGISSDSCHMGFIGEITKYIKSLEICTPPHVQIHCIDGWLINLASLQALWQDLQCYEVKYLLTRRLNQDCLENLFGKLRLRGGSCDHPTAFAFSKALKSVVNNDLFQSPLLSNRNCEIDESLFPDVTLQCETDFPAPEFDDFDTEDSFTDNLPLAEVNGLVYVVGWTCRKFLKSHACEICREQLVDSKGNLDSSKLFCHFKAEERSEYLFGGLTLPSNPCLQHFKVESLVRS